MKITKIDFNFSKVLSFHKVCVRAITINDVKMHVLLFISEDVKHKALITGSTSTSEVSP